MFLRFPIRRHNDALLRFGGRRFDADLVIFDKDGTLIDFDALWGPVVEGWITGVVTAAGEGSGLAAEIYRDFGYDVQRGRVAPHGPMATAAMSKLHAIAAIALFRRGWAWDEAEALVETAWRDLERILRWQALIRPIGGLAGLFGRLKRADVKIAVVTSDDRAETIETLALVGVADHVDALVCGDDPMPAKPAPQAVWAACQEAEAALPRTVIVGDTPSDLIMGRRAGLGLCVGVLSGVGSKELLVPYADVVLDSIEEIEVQRG